MAVAFAAKNEQFDSSNENRSTSKYCKNSEGSYSKFITGWVYSNETAEWGPWSLRRSGGRPSFTPPTYTEAASSVSGISLHRFSQWGRSLHPLISFQPIAGP